MTTTFFTTRRLLGAVVVVLAAAAGLVLLNATRAEAATTDCCKTTYSSDGKTMYITGYVAYRGELLYMSVGGQRCLSRAGKQRAYIKATIPTKYMPNGRHPISIVSKVNGEVKYYTQWFTIKDSPAVSVEVTAPKGKVVLTDSPTMKLAKMGAIKKSVCTLDGSGVGCGGAEVDLSGLSEGRHVFKATVKGRDGYSSTDKKVFKVDTQAPTAPTVTGGDGEWTNEMVELRASGSTDAGAGFKTYQWQRSTDGGATWGSIQKTVNTYVDREGETHFRFRAVDRAGRKSDWVPAVTRIDRTAPEGIPAVSVTDGDPCAGQFPVTLTGSGGTDALSGPTYRWHISEFRSDGTTVDSEEVGPAITLPDPATYYSVYVFLNDLAGNYGEEVAVWDNYANC